jgi:hypothetical protein
VSGRLLMQCSAIDLVLLSRSSVATLPHMSQVVTLQAM